MIAYVLDADRPADVVLPRPRAVVPARLDEVAVPTPAARPTATSSAQDPFLVAARLEESAAVLAWTASLALLVVVGLVVAFVLVP